MSITVESLLSRLQGVRKNGGGWQARCPSHEDTRASLSISEGDDHRILLHCHAGCPTKAVVEKLGVQMHDLAPPGRDGKARIVGTYDYTDADGTLLYQVVRMEPKNFRQRRPDGDGWVWNVKGVKRVPYRLPELASDTTATVFVVEGEKDCDRLIGLGCSATCNAGGGGKIELKLGILGNDKRFHDSAAATAGTVTLATEWRQVVLPLAGKDLSCIKTGFCWVVAGQGKPVVFYLDDVRYE